MEIREKASCSDNVKALFDCGKGDPGNGAPVTPFAPVRSSSFQDRHTYIGSIGSMEEDKKVKTVAEEAPTMDETEDFSFDATLKKKKKKKKASEETTAASASAANEEASTVPAEGEETITQEGDAAVPAETMAEETSTGAANRPPTNNADLEAGWQNSDRDYTYQELLTRVFNILRQNNPDLAGDRRKFTIIPPIIGREGSKKTAFANIADVCRRIRRPIEHVTQFLLTEMGTTGNMDGNQRLIIKGRFQQLQFENLLRRYVLEYVTCKTCRSPDTQLTKENRLFFVKCDSCGSTRTVATIKAGFTAQTGRRVRTE